jgi:hypothetical protein
MATKDAHRALAEELLGQMRKSQAESEWPIAVDTGFYAVFHALEALNAIECRDSYSFADAADILDNVLTGRVLKPSVRQGYQYLFYFRRGALYGCHTPTQAQIGDYCNMAERCYTQIAEKLDGTAKRASA